MGLVDILQRYDAVDRITRFIHHKEIIPLWSDWCVRIADDPGRKLCEERKAPISQSITVPVNSVTTARNVQKHLIKRYGMDGGPSDGENPRVVYVFKKSG